jgi:hypothetical protein
MSAVIQAAWVSAPAVLRSILPGRKMIRVPDPYRRRAAGALVVCGDVCGPSGYYRVRFFSFVTVVWSFSFAFAILQSANPLSADALRVFGALEGILIRVDAAACGIVLFFGITRYVLNVMKGDS